MDSGLYKQKALKRQKGDAEDEDIIMNMLPESLVSRILSFLPTKDAVRTSVLSKRWKHQWLSITNLVLNDTVFYSQKKKKMSETQHFVIFVNKALLLTQYPSLESFTLVIRNDYDMSLVNTWITSALNRKLKKLCIHSVTELPFSSDTCNSLFNCELLEELELSLSMYWHPAYYPAGVTVPTNYVHLGHLKSLRLNGVTFIIESSDYPKFSFPLLQKFEAIDCTWVPSRHVIFEVPMLETIFMEIGPESQFFQPGDCCIEFAASHLKEITYSSYGYVTQYITELDPSSLSNANASIILDKPDMDCVSVTGFRVFLLLKQFSQVKYLKFEGSEVLSLSKVALLPSFGMLNHLELGIVGGEVLIGLLLKSPVLKSLIFKELPEFDQELVNSASVPDCLQHTLEVVKFGKVKGLEHELCVAKFLMRNGLVLKKMSFSVATEMAKSKALEEFKEKLFSVKKGFNLAVVEFLHI